MRNKYLYILALITLGTTAALGQSNPKPKSDSLSKFDQFNKKAEAFFKVVPVPLISYSVDAGNVFGLAKFNTFHAQHKDSISRLSKISEVATFSTKGRVNVSVSNDLILDKDRYMILSYFNYKEQPEYMLGIGNDVSRDDVEQVITNRMKFSSTALIRVKKFIYAGIAVDVSNYFGIEIDSNSFMIAENTLGQNGGTDVGLGFSGALDSRDNRYNASKGALVYSTLMFYPNAFGSTYKFARFDLDMRKYFKPWPNLKHIIAVQATTGYSGGDVPYYDLSLLGGEDKMRGYYKGAIRDKVLVDGQVEYRMHIWNIFGIVGWVGAGRVGTGYNDLALNGFRLSYGGGLRIRVDSGSNVNLRVDMGFGPGGVSGLYINFSEAF